MPLIAPQLSHMGIFTDRPEEMQAFYADVLGMAVSDEGMGNKFPRKIIFMTGNSSQHHQLVLVVRDEGDPPGGCLFQASFKVRDLDELRVVTARAQRRNAAEMRQINHGNSWSVYFRDPDNNMVEVYLDTGWYVAQPFADELELGRSDEEIVAATNERVGQEPGACPQEEWAVRMADKLDVLRGAVR